MKRLIVALLVGGMVFGAAYGAAASLGDSIDTPTLAEGSADVEGCGGDIEIAFLTQQQDGDGHGARFQVKGVTVSGIAGCDGKYLLMGLTDDGKFMDFASSGLNNCTFTELTPPNGQIGQIVSGEVTINLCSSGGSSPYQNAEDVTDIHLLVKDTAS